MLGGELSNFFEDLQIVRPTILHGVPRTWVMVRDEFLTALKIEYPFLGFLFSFSFFFFFVHRSCFL